MDFVYFIVGPSAANTRVLAAVGLDKTIGRAHSFVAASLYLKGDRVCPRGTPSADAELRGILISAAAEALRIEPEQQVWERAQAEPECWIAYEKTAPPNELSLRRTEFRGGYPVMMGNGEEWFIPPARRYPDGTALPCACKLDADGNERKELLAEYLDLWTEVGKFAEPYYAGLKGERDEARVYPDMPLGTCIRLLSINYRVGRAEVNALSLITDTARVQIGLAAIDWWAFVNMLSKEMPQADPTQGA